MTLYRFVNRDGWEKWIDIPEVHPPPHYKIADNPRLSVSRPPSDLKATKLITLLFEQQSWRYDGYEEFVYVEDGAMLPDSDRFGTDRPSLYREQQIKSQYRDLYFRLRDALNSLFRAPIDTRAEVGCTPLAADTFIDEVERRKLLQLIDECPKCGELGCNMGCP